jgi:Secretion system C-terminal sorting domain
MKKSLLLLLVFLCFSSMLDAQTRYLDNVYSATQVRRADSVRYAVNKSLLAFYFGQATRSTPWPLHADVYQPPTTDTITKRPLVIYMHTGSFFPAYALDAGGSLRDSTAVEVCTRFARMGYVAASMDYRTGWAPTLSVEELRRFTLINASYRGIQDVRSCIRFFKLNAATYGIDTNKIMLFGQGTGGYLSLGAATLNNISEIANTEFGPNKFFFNNALMVNEGINGNIDGTSFGIVPANLPDTSFMKRGDTLCVPTNLGPTSNFQMQVNLGGALGDLTWIDATSVPSLSFQAPYDPFAPYSDGVLRVNSATGPQPVIRVQGADSIARRYTRLGLNNVFKSITAANDPYKTVFANRAVGGANVIGLYPILGDSITDASPWDFWGANTPKASESIKSAPRSTPARARLYIDTIMRVVAPRACLALNLPCKGFVSSTEELLKEYATKLVVSPNPAQSVVTFESEVYNPIQSIELFDLSGRSINYVKNINSSNYQLNRGAIPNGMYIAKVKFEGGILSKKIVFDGR